MSDEKNAPEGEPFAWTDDDVIERGVEEFKRLWPERWQAWLDWCEQERNAPPTSLPPVEDQP